MYKQAIAMLEAEIQELANAREGSPLWVVRQAKSFGLSLLKAAQQYGYEDPGMLDIFRKKQRVELQAGEPTTVTLTSAKGLTVGDVY